VGPDPGHGDDGLLDARRGAGFIAQALEPLAEHVQHFGLIIDHEDTAAAHHGTGHERWAPPSGVTSAPRSLHGDEERPSERARVVRREHLFAIYDLVPPRA
jgi:hypothetical protein